MKTFLKNFNTLLVVLISSFTVCHVTYTQGIDSIRPLPKINKEFLVAVHVVHNDTLGNLGIDFNAIDNAIKSINPLFEPIGVSFKVCGGIHEIKNFKFDTIMKGEQERQELINQHHIKGMINFYYVTALFDENKVPVGGDAELGGITYNNDGIFITKSSNGLYVIGHEMGHYFGLDHTFKGNGEEHANGDNCATSGDKVCDTPADPFVFGESERFVKDCKFIFNGKDANNEFYTPSLSNIMSYYFCGCGDFTHGQYTKMANTYLLNDKSAW